MSCLNSIRTGFNCLVTRNIFANASLHQVLRQRLNAQCVGCTTAGEIAPSSGVVESYYRRLPQFVLNTSIYRSDSPY